MTQDAINRRAGGRRRINAQRKAQAWERRKAIIDAIGEGTCLLPPHGLRANLAEHFGVNRSTISRDIDAIREVYRRPRQCPICRTTYLQITLKAAAKLAKRGLWDGCTTNHCAKLEAALKAK